MERLIITPEDDRLVKLEEVERLKRVITDGYGFPNRNLISRLLASLIWEEARDGYRDPNKILEIAKNSNGAEFDYINSQLNKLCTEYRNTAEKTQVVADVMDQVVDMGQRLVDLVAAIEQISPKSELATKLASLIKDAEDIRDTAIEV